MSGTARSIVVVGAGLAGLRACEGLREQGYEGRLTLIGDELHAPYDRPPLSKQFLAGDWGVEKVVLRSDDKLAALDLDFRNGPDARAVKLDIDAKRVTLAGGEDVAYDGLVLATGSSARRLPQLDRLPNVFVLRTVDDAVAIQNVLKPGAHLGLVGAGFIGLEVAATARKLGLEVTVVEPLAVPLGRVLGPGGAACGDIHREEGVRLRLQTAVESASSQSDGSLVCQLSDGSHLQVDALLVGIGAAPDVRWLEGSGLDANDGGVTVDERLMAAPGITAVGDLARWPMPANGGPESVRVEHRTNAAEQGDWAARALLEDLGHAVKSSAGLERTYEVPYVWSDQYNVKIQILGLPRPDDDIEVVEGTPADRRFVALYSRGGRLAAVVGYSRHVMSLRPLLARNAATEEARALVS